MTPWTLTHQVSLSIEFPRQEYWSGWPFLSPGDLPNPGFEPGSPAPQADSLPTELQGEPSLVVTVYDVLLFLLKLQEEGIQFN